MDRVRGRTDRRSWLSTLMACAVPGAWLAPAQAADLPSLIAAAKPSVVPVGTFNATANPRFEFRGSGFVVGDGNLVATNFHVLADGAESESGPQMAVLGNRVGNEAEVRKARVVATDRNRDLALLKIEGPPMPALTLAEAGSAREGQRIALIGFPIGGTLGFAAVTHSGIVASVTTVGLPAPSARQLDPRAISQLRRGNFEVLQLDAIAYPGNSGGPLIDAETGQVLGIINMVLIKGTRESALSSPTGITYAVPVGLLRELLSNR